MQSQRAAVKNYTISGILGKRSGAGIRIASAPIAEDPQPAAAGCPRQTTER